MADMLQTVVEPRDDRRRHERTSLPAAYTRVLVRRPGRSRFSLAGHAYDISAGGIRFELDKPLPVGEEVDVKLKLPGVDTPLRAHGTVIRFHDPDEVGPVRMGLKFNRVITDGRLFGQYVKASAA